MHTMPRVLSTSLPLALSLSCVWPASSLAQGFSADYGLGWPGSSIQTGFGLSDIRIAPTLASTGNSSGAGLTLHVGENWFGGFGIARSVAPQPVDARDSYESVNLSGGYRFGNGQVLALEVNRGRVPGQRLGLAVNYDWPRYFVRFTYDPGSGTALPQESLKFSAGLRF